MKIEFTIPGKPQAKQRIRAYFNPHLKSVKTYTPDQTANFETYVKLLYSELRVKPFDCPVAVKINTFYKIQTSGSKQVKADKLSGKIRPDVKPDLDNIAKSILDGLNGVAWVDDRQIVDLSISKHYANEYYTKVEIMEVVS